MARLPTRDDLGGLPSVRTNRVTPQIRVVTPNVSAASEAKVAASRQMGDAQLRGLDRIGASQKDLSNSKLMSIQTQGEAGVAEGEGLQNVGKALANISDLLAKKQDQEDTLTAIKVSNAYDIDVSRFKRELYSDQTEYKAWPEKLEAYLAERGPRAVADMPAQLQGKWAEQFKLSQENDRNDNYKKTDEVDGKRQKVDLFTSAESKREAYLDPLATPEEKAKDRLTILSWGEASFEKGLISESEYLSWREKFGKEIVKEDAELQLKRSPEKLSRKLVFSRKAPTVMQRLMTDLSLTKDQAAGVVGNLGHESGGFLLYSEINGGGVGWAQWTGPRRKSFENWAEANGLDPKSDDANYGYLVHELTGEYAGALDAVRAAPSVKDAMLAFEETFERAGVKAYGSRLRYAQAALASFDGDQSGDEFANLDPVDRAEMETKTADALSARLKVGSVFEATEQFANPLKVWSPIDSDDKKRVDALTEESDGPARLVARDEGYFENDLAPLVTQTGMIPGSIKGTLSGMLRASAPATVVHALQTMDQLERLNPQAFDRDMGADLTKKVTRYRESSPFRSPEEIVADIQSSEDPSRAKARDAATKEGQKLAADVSDGTITNHFDLGLFYWEPGMPSEHITSGELRNNFDRLFAEEYAALGDTTKAQNSALRLLETTWGSTDATGNRQLMKHPPEKYYNVVGLDPSWIAEQAKSDITPLLVEGETEYVLRADDTTEMEIANKLRPSYLIMVEKPGGFWVPLWNDQINKPKRIVFDAAPFIAKHKKTNEESRAKFAVDHASSVKFQAVTDMEGPQDAASTINTNIPGP